MPQPVRKLKHLTLDPDSLMQRPVPMAMLAVVAVRWTAVERALAELFVGLLRREDMGALAIYGELIDQNVRKAAFDALARTRLEPESFVAFQRLYAKVQKKSKKRHRMIHATWGISDEHPDGILLVDQIDILSADFAFKQTKFTGS